MVRLCLLIVPLALFACDKSSTSGKEEAGKAAAGGKGGGGAAAAEQTKLSAAIECLNRHSNAVFETRASYLESVDPATGAPATKGAKPTLLGLYGLEPCSRLVKEAGALTPAVADLDAASAAYLAALEKVHADYGALTAYYEKGEHLDDAGKKAETLHPAAMAAFDAFRAAHQTLDAQVSDLNRRRRQEDLAAREKAEGRNLEVIIDTMMLEAETLVAMASGPAPDAAAVEKTVDAYGKLVDEMDAYAAAHADEAKGRGSIANLQNYAKTFLAASKVIKRKLAEKAEPTPEERDAVIQQYNSLVTNYNNH